MHACTLGPLGQLLGSNAQQLAVFNCLLNDEWVRENVTRNSVKSKMEDILMKQINEMHALWLSFPVFSILSVRMSFLLSPLELTPPPLPSLPPHPWATIAFG